VSGYLTVDRGAQRFGDPGPQLRGDLVAELLDNPPTWTYQNVWAHPVSPPSVSLALRLARRVPLTEIDRKNNSLQISKTSMNETQQDRQTVAATLEQQVGGPRNMQLARRTARASCMSVSRVSPLIHS
jgi:hypothetical protein